MSIWGTVRSWLTSAQLGTDKNNPASMSPAVMAWQWELALVRTLYAGFQELYAQRSRFLPQHPKEDPQDYYIRANRPTFYNAFARTVRALAGIVFREAPEPEGVPAEILEFYEDDIDNEGTDGPSFLRGAFQDSLVTGLAGIFVDQPSLEAAPGQVLSRADELAAGIRPYWTLVCKDAIVSFRTETENGTTRLVQLVFRDERQVADGQFGVKVIERLRVYRRLPAEQVGESGDTIAARVTERFYEEVDGTYKSVGVLRQLPVVEEIPFAVIYAGEREGMLKAKPPLYDLATENLLHYQTRSDLHHAAHLANVPFLFGGGFPAEELQIGPNRAIIIAAAKREEAWLQWMETTGASLGSTRAILGDIDEYMANLGLGMLQRKSRAAQTAEKASLDKQEQDSTLAGIVGDLEDGIERALYYTSLYLGLSTWGRLTFSRDFQMAAPTGANRTENQGDPPAPKEPTAPGVTNNPATSA